MPNQYPMKLIFQVSLGEVPPFYNFCNQSVEQYAKRIGADYEILREPKLKITPLNSKRSTNALRLGYLPIYEKEVAFEYFPLYDEICIIDSDIYIKEDAPDIFEQIEFPVFYGVREHDMPLTPEYRNKLRKFAPKQYGSYYPFYNMGVMLMDSNITEFLDDTPEQFLRRKEFEKFVNGEGHYKWSTDQTLLNHWIRDSGMEHKAIDWKWNTLVKAVPDDRLHEAYFLHFFLSAKYPKKGAEIPDIVNNLDKAKLLKRHG